MEYFTTGLRRITVAVSTVLLCNPAFAAEPILLKDVAPGNGSVYVTGTTDTHHYFKPFPPNGVFAIDGSGHTITKVLNNETNLRMTGFGAIALFSYNDNIHGYELWRSDGTPAGTYLVKDLMEGPTSSFTGIPTVWKDRVYFSNFAQKNQLNLPNPDDPANYDPPQLWSTDGTNEGTRLVTNLDTLTWFWDGEYGDWGSVEHMKAGHDRLFFVVSASNPVSDYDYVNTLWQSDGTSEGTFQMMRPDIDEPVLASVFLESLGGITFFADNQRAEPPPSEDNPEWTQGDLWQTDGSPEGTIRLSRALAYPAMHVFDGKAYFVLRDESGLHLARSGDHAAGVETVATLRPAPAPDEVTYVNISASTTSLFFRVVGTKNNARTFNELWRFSGSDQTVALIPNESDSFDVGAIQDDALFFAGGPENDVELWRSDGTALGTALFADLNPTGSSFPYFSPNLAGAMWFSADNGSSRNLYRSDGTLAGTAAVYSSPAFSSSPQNFLALRNGTILFNVENGYYYASRGTPETTSVIELSEREIGCPNFCDPRVLPVGNRALFLGLLSATLWSIDGSNNANGTRVVKEAMWPVNDFPSYPVAKENTFAPLGHKAALFFALERHPDWESGQMIYLRKLWRTDGTQDGTTLVKTFSLLPEDVMNSGGLMGLIVHRGLAYFMADDGEHGKELWRSDGTEAGTYMVKDLIAGAGDTVIETFTSARHHAYFTYSDQNDVHLAITRGSAADTRRIATLPRGPYYAYDFVAVNDDIYFVRDQTLYRSNGRPGNLHSVGWFAQRSRMTAFGNHLYFVTLQNGNDPLQVWRISSKKSNAEIVTPSFNVRASSAQDVGFTVHGNRLFLSVMDRSGQNGGIFELCTRGKTSRWVQHTAMSAKELYISGDKMYFAGLDEQYGEEPRVMPLPDKP